MRYIVVGYLKTKSIDLFQPISFASLESAQGYLTGEPLLKYIVEYPRQAGVDIRRTDVNEFGFSIKYTKGHEVQYKIMKEVK